MSVHAPAIPTQSPGASLSQAQNEALVRYGPQRFALQQLIMQALQTRDLAVHAALGASRGIQSTINQARGETAGNYATALATTGDTRALVDSALAKVGGGAASPFQAAIAGERGAATDRLTLGEANALQDLTNRRVQAASGAAFATQHATDQFARDVNQVRQSYEQLAGEQGAFTQGRVAELKKEAADRQFQYDLAQYSQSEQNQRSRISARTQRRGQDLTHQDRQAATQQRHQDATARLNATGNRIGSKGPKLASQEAHTSLWQQIQGALPDAKTQKQLGRNYGETANLLTNGRHQAQITDPTKLDATGKPVKLPVPAIAKRGRLAAIVAADLAYKGGITQRTMNILHSHGFSTRQLQLQRQPSPGRGLGGPYGTGRMGN